MLHRDPDWIALKKKEAGPQIPAKEKSLEVSSPITAREKWEGRSQRYKEGLERKVLVAQLCLTLCDPMDCGLTVSSVPGVL